MKDLIEKALMIIGIMFIVWFAVSYGEVLVKNLSPNPHYWSLNLFYIFFGKQLTNSLKCATM